MEAGRERKLVDFFMLKMDILGDEKESSLLNPCPADPSPGEERKTLWDFYFKLLIY